MRVPPYYRKPEWQRFFSGAAVGALVSWVLFLYMNGAWMEKHAKTIEQQKDEIADLKSDIEIWMEDYEELNKKNQEKLTVQEIKVKIVNDKKYKQLDTLSIYEIEEETKGQLNMLLAKDLDSVFKSRELITKVIENKSIRISDKRYKLKIKSMVIYTSVSILVEISLD
ncbi:sporulation protein [Mesobacillus sp. AQ2]|uniref:sporulation membrane protein YtrI n=1 Tax=Bacillaceae TaxID=186817 RepID=UPI00119DC668|nr:MULTISPECIES: sporulation membrane protein YtrI [Bacillaceae]MCM3122704.1 sporulation protein [Mesobacillus sp. MER 33]MCM3232668.1 sporulation protein [Mesobacillus sp. MER 48]WHX39593.1 sporulation protein [Mesobacillus sp. AQ2]